MSIKIRNTAVKLFCVVLCWALLIAPCAYLTVKNFNAEDMAATAVTVPAITPSSPVGGTVPANAVVDNDDPPVQDLFANSDNVLSAPADKILASIQLSTPEAAAGKAPALYVPPVVSVPEEPVVDEPVVEEPTVDDPVVEEPVVDEPEDNAAIDNGSVGANSSEGFYGNYAILTQPDGSPFIYYDQTWEAYDNYPYGSATIGGYGCGPTSMAMVVSNLTGTMVTPAQMGDWSAANGYFVRGRGTAYGLFPAVAAKYGISCTTISSADRETVVSSLKQGKLLLTIVGPGDFTVGRHFLLIRGITDDGKLLLADSGKYENALTEWDYDRVMRQISGGQFWIFE